VLEFHGPYEEIIDRMAGRRVHVASGRTYHLRHKPPQRAGLDDLTGEALVQRDDDREEVVRKRLQVYRQQTARLVGYYQQWAASGQPRAPRYQRISGLGSIGAIRERVLGVLG
jgi:adenylate kinase